MNYNIPSIKKTRLVHLTLKRSALPSLSANAVDIKTPQTQQLWQLPTCYSRVALCQSSRRPDTAHNATLGLVLGYPVEAELVATPALHTKAHRFSAFV